MKERPILFSGPMVRAILEGRKSQERQVVKPQPFMKGDWGLTWEPKAPKLGPSYSVRNVNWNPITNAFEDFYRDQGGSPFGTAGDRLWVKETHRFDGLDPKIALRSQCLDEISYRADMQGDRACDDCAWRPSIFMPRWASRITLEITGVRVERLNQISEADAKAEGIGSWRQKYPRGSHDIQGYDTVYNFGRDLETRWFPTSSPNAVLSYKRLWESINGPGSWDANPYVWVIEFRRVK